MSDYDHDVKRILGLLHDEIGLSAHSVGSGVVIRAVKTRMGQCGSGSIADYLRYLTGNRREMALLIDTVVVPETSFFRDNAPFKAFADFVRSKWLASSDRDVLRVLSLPCSTGEEPYSIAMVMFECGVEPSRFQIDAVDISERLLQVGRAGQYTEYSFRGTPDHYRHKYFVHKGEHYHLSEEIRGTVNFIQGNILDEEFVTSLRAYHVIFCRNLLIYFDLPTKRSAVSHLNNILHPGGLLFVGHAETTHVPQPEFTRLDYPMAFGFNKEGVASHDTVSGMNAVSPIQQAKPSALQKLSHTPFKPLIQGSRVGMNRMPDTPIMTEISIADVELDGLTELKQLMARQQTALALELAISMYPDWDTHSDFLYQFSLLHLTMGDDLYAEEQLRRVIYLDPNHHQALEQLALLADKRFDLTSAKNYRRRADRVRERTRTNE